MLAFGLKLAWFALSLSGLIGCWAVLLPLAWATQCYWGPLAYAVGITCLHGTFCVGLVWKLNPPEMPIAFCFVQVLLTGLAVFFITGTLAAITTATTACTAKPKQWGMRDDTTVLRWRYYYLLPMVLFPLLASTVHATFVIFFSDFDIADGMTCVPHPLWLRFVGFAGTPFLITLPCLWATVASALRVIQTHKHIRRARRSVQFENLDRFTTRPPRKARSRPSLKLPTPRAITTPSPAPSIMLQMRTLNAEPRRQAVSPVIRAERYRSFHLPFFEPASPSEHEYTTPPSGPHSQSQWSAAQEQNGNDQNSFDTVSSVSFADMTNTNSHTNNTGSRSRSRPEDSVEEYDVRTPLRMFESAHSTTRSTRGTRGSGTRSMRNSDRISLTQLALNMEHAFDSSGFELETGTASDKVSLSEFFDDARSTTSYVSGITSPKPTAETPQFRNLSELSSTIRSLLVFQFAIIAIHFLSAITPLADVISARREPAPLGTQHVALILFGWAPVVIFGPLSAVRSQLAFWR